MEVVVRLVRSKVTKYAKTKVKNICSHSLRQNAHVNHTLRKKVPEQISRVRPTIRMFKDPEPIPAHPTALPLPDAADQRHTLKASPLPEKPLNERPCITFHPSSLTGTPCMPHR